MLRSKHQALAVSMSEPKQDTPKAADEAIPSASASAASTAAVVPPKGEPKPEVDGEKYSLKVKSEYVLSERSSVLAPIPLESASAVPADAQPKPSDNMAGGDSENDNRGKKKKKKRGQNKKRPRDLKIADEDKLCFRVVAGEECPYGAEKCRYSHDVKKALADRLPDITTVEGGCPAFNLTGYCEYGLHCRLGAEHINLATGENLRKKIEEYDPKKVEVVNLLPKDVQIQLRRKKFPFVCKRHFEQKKEDSSADLTPLPTKERKLVDFRNKVYVAPLTTVGNLPFRRIMKKFGADITCGEMAVGTSLLQGQNSEWALLKRHPEEDVFGVQIAAGFADQFTRTSELLEKFCTVDFVDVNMGCPLDIVNDKQAGAALMMRESKLRESLLGMSRSLSCPFTVKMRTGWEEEKPFAHLLVPKIQSWKIEGLNALMVHGRSRLQRYNRAANWDYVAQVANSQSDDLPKIPIIGNGDVFSFSDYEEKVAREGIETTAMLARGALIKPWLPTEIKERRHWDISASERLDILKDFVRFGLEHWGTDQQGVNNTRRFMLEWLSFLYRYVPVGMLEVVPQQMNQRPPNNLCGRSDLETLMLSPHCADWIRISEMLLGKVPDGFAFAPKHKANAFKK